MDDTRARQLQKFKVTAVLHGFHFTGKSQDGTVQWYRSNESLGFRRISIDAITNPITLTVYWQNVPSSAHEITTSAKQFHTVEEFDQWMTEQQVEGVSCE